MSLSDQHLNLLDGQVRPRPPRFTAAQGGLVLGLLALLLVLFDAGLRWGIQRRQARGDALQAELSSLQARLNIASPRASALAEQALRIGSLRQQDEALQALSRSIASGNAGRPEGYAAWLQALWRQGGADELWLTGFKTDGVQLELSGRLLEAAALPAYLRRLEKEPLFRGQHFAQLRLSPNTVNEQVSDFSLSAGGSPAGNTP